MNMARYSQAQFREGLADDDKKELFKQHVSNVVIEISSHCNRVCGYCPVSQVDRRSTRKQMPAQMFESIIANLAEISFAGDLCLNLYNEPTSDRQLLLQRITEARRCLPNAKIYFSSNGDYLSESYVSELVEAGLSELYVTLHSEPTKAYQDETQLTRFSELSVRLGKPIKITSVALGQSIHGSVEVRGLPIHVFSVNYFEYGVNRAGLVHRVRAEQTRQSPCDRPFRDFTVSYDGTIFPCCQFFVDDAGHKSKYAIGNVADFPTIFDAFASDAMVGWRRGLFTVGPKAKPCDTCLEGECKTSEEEASARVKMLHETLNPQISAASMFRRASKILKGALS